MPIAQRLEVETPPSEKRSARLEAVMAGGRGGGSPAQVLGEWKFKNLKVVDRTPQGADPPSERKPPQRPPPIRPNEQAACPEISPKPVPGALSRGALKSDAQVLNSIFDLGLKAKTAIDSERAAALNEFQAQKDAQPAIDKAREALFAMTLKEYELLEAVEIQPPEMEKHEKAQKDFETARTTLAIPQAELACASDKLAAAKHESATAAKALAAAIDSQAFNFDAMSATDLAKLGMVLVDNPQVVSQSAGRIQSAALARFAAPDPDTVHAIADAPQDEATSRALANAITDTKPRRLAALFMSVQEQPHRLDNHRDPFIGKLLDRMGDIDLHSMQSFGFPLDAMTSEGRDTYINQLDKKISRSVIALARDNSKDHEGLLRRADAFERCHNGFAAHFESWSLLRQTKPAEEQTPFLASLTTTELAELFNAVHQDARWSATDSGRALIAEVTSLFSQRLMSTDGNTPQKELDEIAKAANSTPFVANLLTRDVGHLFKLLQQNAGAWLKEGTASFTAQVNSRFLHECLDSIGGATADEREWWSTVLGDLGNKWNANVAGAVDRAHVNSQELQKEWHENDIADSAVANENQEKRDLRAQARTVRASAREERLAARMAREAERQNGPETGESESAREADKKQEAADKVEAKNDQKEQEVDAALQREAERNATNRQTWAREAAEKAQMEVTLRQPVAEASTPFGTLNVDDVAELFLVNQKLALDAKADVLTEAVARKFAACYPQVALKIHQKLIESFPDMSSEGQQIFTAAVNRPPRELAPLLEQVFKPLNTLVSKTKLDEAELPSAFKQVVEYHTGLPGAGRTDEELFDWLRAALPAVNATNSMLRAFNSAGPLREAWLAPQGDFGRYLGATARATQALDAENWQEWSARISVTQLFAGQSWTSALQQHFDGLFKLKPPGLDPTKCTVCLDLLRTHQELKAKSGLFEWQAKKIIEKLKTMDENRFFGRAFENFDMASLSDATRRERLAAVIELCSPLAARAANELLSQGRAAYKSNPSNLGRSVQARAIAK